jgi:transcription antitermination factor NusG
MDSIQLKNWYAVYTKPRQETRVCDALKKRKIEFYCPANKVPRKWTDRKKYTEVPLFSSMVFLKTSPLQLAEVLKIDGVVNLVHWHDSPAIINNLEIETIKNFIGDHTNVSLEKTQVSVKDKVRIITGPLIEQAGLVVAMKSKSVKVLLPSLGYIMSAEVSDDKIELVSSTFRRYDEMIGQVN